MIVRNLVAVVCLLVSMSTLPAVAAPADDALRDELTFLRQSQVFERTAPALGLKEVIELLKALLQNAEARRCADHKWVANSPKFVTSFDAKGDPCRIYDLSFPVLRPLLRETQVSSVPVQKLGSEDYRAWLHGDFEAVYRKLYGGDVYRTDVRKVPLAAAGLNESWYSTLEFKRPGKERGDDPSFRLSDLKIGADFQFNDELKQDLRLVIEALRALAPELGESVFRAMEELVEHPERILEKVRFVWNKDRRVFDVFADFDFFPISGPVDLVDYGVQYKQLVEWAGRFAFRRALNVAVDSIPSRTVKRIVGLGINETFAFVDELYATHQNALEQTLRMNISGELDSRISRWNLEKGLNLLFLKNFWVVADALKRGGEVAPGEPSLGVDPLGNLDKMGLYIRFKAGKAREALAKRLFDDLRSRRHCEPKLFKTHFAACAGPADELAIYSLLTETHIYSVSSGAPLSHRFGRPAEVLVRRTTAYLMAMSLKAAGLPIPGRLVNELAGIFRRFATAGVEDEAFLLDGLIELKRARGASDPESEQLIHWLFLQNLNPFAPKSQKGEDRVIEVNLQGLRRIQ